MERLTKLETRGMKEIFLENLTEGEVKFVEPMKDHTSLRIGGPADIFVVPGDVPSLVNIRTYFKKKNIRFFPLGGGTNILVMDGGIEGAVVSFKSLKRIVSIREDNKDVCLFVEAGTSLQKVVNFSKESGYSGVEGLAGIPGTVGGAVCGNAGAFGYEMKDVLVSVEIMDGEGKIDKIKAEEINFDYRISGIPPDVSILSAEIKLRKGKKEDVAARTDGFLKMKLEKQPLREPSAGCVFKNPEGLSAGKLIEEAGCKGLRIGDVEVSHIHANFFINKGNAKASDFIGLMEEVARMVKAMSGVILVPEIRIVGRSIDN
jgi:UDP-N-acetylmuramate dehydrogenase